MRLTLEATFNIEPDFGDRYYSRKILLLRMSCSLHEEDGPRITLLLLRLPTDPVADGNTHVTCTHEGSEMLLPSSIGDVHFRAAQFDGQGDLTCHVPVMRMDLVSAALDVSTCNFVAITHYMYQ